jgi:hypothetical protein
VVRVVEPMLINSPAGVGHAVWHLGVPTMDADPKWYQAQITSYLPGNLCNLRVRTEDNRWVPVYGAKVADLLYTRPQPPFRLAEYEL